jgi:hypothetical protein
MNPDEALEATASDTFWIPDDVTVVEEAARRSWNGLWKTAEVPASGASWPGRETCP